MEDSNDLIPFEEFISGMDMDDITGISCEVVHPLVYQASIANERGDSRRR